MELLLSDYTILLLENTWEFMTAGVPLLRGGAV